MTHARTRSRLVGLLAVILILLLAPSLWAQSIPSYSSLAETVAKELGYPNRTSEDGAGQVTREVAARIYWVVGDHDFGLLKKKPGQTQYMGHGIDVLLHRPTGIVVDIITASGTATSTIAWQVQDKPEYPRYDDSYFVIPPKPATTPADPPDDPPTAPEPPAAGPTLAEALAQLQAQLAAIAAKVDTLAAKVDAVSSQVAALPASRPWPVYRGSIPWLGSVTLTPQER